MRSYNHGRFQQQAIFLRRQFLQDGDLPFTDVLSEGIVAQALTAINVVWLDRIYSPLVALWVFFAQVLGAVHSCREAVARLIAHRLAQGQRPCSPTTGASAKLESVCRNNFSRRWPAWSGAPWTPRPTLNGFGKDGAFTCSTERR